MISVFMYSSCKLDLEKKNDVTSVEDSSIKTGILRKQCTHLIFLSLVEKREVFLNGNFYELRIRDV